MRKWIARLLFWAMVIYMLVAMGLKDKDKTVPFLENQAQLTQSVFVMGPRFDHLKIIIVDDVQAEWEAFGNSPDLRVQGFYAIAEHEIYVRDGDFVTLIHELWHASGYLYEPPW